MVLRRLLGLVLAAFLAVPPAQAETLRLRVSAMPNGAHQYYLDLLREALEAAGHEVVFDTLNILPQPRIEAGLRDGLLDIHWFLRSPERDRSFLSVPVGLTGGLISQRVLLVRTGEAGRFAGVRTVEELRALGLTAGFGQGWFDSLVWRHNNLKALEIGGEWRNLYAMVSRGNRDIDYLPRGVTEILAEAAGQPGLAIEPSLLLHYEGDQILYLSPRRADLEPLIRPALEAYERTGAITRRALAEWGDDLERLQVSRRHVIELASPQ
ncbi:MAG TPA: hypothetical protein VED40_06665 [Azospirillaceae bacterium]|nr:hypothetical protein [Azospirillaceae bacterium]